jgi:hypothetical protein
MRVVQFAAVSPAEPVRKGFRGGDIRFRDLLLGKEGAFDNYGLQWVQVDGAYHTPQHRHNFEQVRIMIEGSFGFGSGLLQEPGSVGYFCEGTYYTQSAETRSVTLLLQVGGPSKSGFMSRDQLRQGVEQLSDSGTFKDGIFTFHDATGKKHHQDSYEAAWEKVNGRAISYPKPQYASPILMLPERFSWVESAPGVGWKSLGQFTERCLTIRQLRLSAGSRFEWSPQSQTHLFFCQEGTGQVGQNPYLQWSSIESACAEPAVFLAVTDTVFWVLGLPRF